MNLSRSIIFIFSLLACTCGFAQGFFKTYPPSSSSAADLVQTDDGGYFMVGKVEADSLLFLQRVNATGQVLWANHLDFSHARAIAVAKTDDGGFAVLTEFYADTNGNNNAVLKLDDTGTVLWSTVIANHALANGLRDIVSTADGGFLLAGDTRDLSLNFKNWLVKLSAGGGIEWQKTFGASYMSISRIAALPSGNYALSGGRNNGDLSLATVTSSGDLLWQQTYAKPGYQKAYDLIYTVDGGLAILATSQNTSLNRLEISVLKTDIDGNPQWINDIFPFSPSIQSPLPVINSFSQDADGNYYLPITNETLVPNGTNILEILKLDPAGNELWKRETIAAGIGQAIIRGSDNYFVIAGYVNTLALLLKLDSEAEIFANKIRGTVYNDVNSDCTLNPGEPGFPSFLIEAYGSGGELFFKKANIDGTYEIRVPEGEFDLVAKPSFGPANFYSVCDTPHVIFVGVNQTIEDQVIGLETLAECPMLEVHVGGGIIRRCTSTVYTVSWCNYGNQTAENASVQLTVDPNLSYFSSSIPFNSQSGNVLTFNLPDVPPGGCGSFLVDFYVNCNASVGDVICVEAHAFPDSTCVPPGANWDGSEIEVSGKCEGSDISFKIKNKGASAMSQGLDYVIIEDHIMYMTGQIQLGAGFDTTITVPNPGGACYLGKVFGMNNDASIVTRPAAVVANCFTGGNLNLALEFETEQNNAAIDNNCSPVVGSYDPNDKTGFPLGWQDQHLLERNQSIEYVIRFQNTGNDTAFLVVIQDSLPLATLDPASLRPIAASHPYTWDVTGQGLATFTFANIQLPDSTTNEPASHGFIRFRVRQQPDLADGTLIENEASIYFDFNEAILTNKYFHTVGSPVILVTQNPTEAQLLDFQVYPNPFSAEATFVLNDYMPKSEVSFRLFDVLGNVVREESFPGNRFLFNAGKLSSGIYFFRMEEDGKILASGKVSISK